VAFIHKIRLGEMFDKTDEKQPFETIAENQAKGIQRVFTENMGVLHEFGKMKFELGPEGAEKRKHVHVRVPGVGSVRYWLTRRIGDEDIKDIELDENTRVGNVDAFEKEAREQIEVYYDNIVENIDRHHKGDPNDPVKKTIGQKTKGQNSPRAVEARKEAERKAAEAEAVRTSGQDFGSDQGRVSGTGTQ
jgi:hypothetical protein